MRKSDGFTLVELMIVVAIVGILATLAIPTWKYASARSRQVEAKTNLNAIAALETSYHGEKNTYGSLVQIGFVPEGVARYSYCVDTTFANCVGADVNPFSSGSGASVPDPIYTPVLPPGGAGGPAMIAFRPTFGMVGIVFFGSASSSVVGGNPYYSGSGFEADAYGIISREPAPHDIDAWSIDSRRQLLNYNRGY